MKYRVRMIVLVVNILSMIVGMMIFTVDYDPEKYLTSEEKIAKALERPLEKNKYKAVNELIDKYIHARFEADMDTLAECVNNPSEYNEEDLKRKSALYESIEKIDCYTVDGYYEGTYFVYVWKEEKIKDMEVVVPSVFGYYVCKYNGKLCVYSGVASTEVAAYIENTHKNPEVVALTNSVNAVCEELKAQHPEYKALVESLNPDGTTITPTATVPPQPESTNPDDSVG